MIDEEFEEVWTLFPRKVAKGQARKAYRAARRKAAFDKIVEGIRRLAVEHQVTEVKFIPHPATWLTGEGWLDEEGKSNGHIPAYRAPSSPAPTVAQHHDG